MRFVRCVLFRSSLRTIINLSESRVYKTYFMCSYDHHSISVERKRVCSSSFRSFLFFSTHFSFPVVRRNVRLDGVRVCSGIFRIVQIIRVTSCVVFYESTVSPTAKLLFLLSGKKENQSKNHIFFSASLSKTNGFRKTRSVSGLRRHRWPARNLLNACHV